MENQILNYKAKNSFNSEVILATKSLLFTAKYSGYPNVYKYWMPIFNKMIELDTNGIEINNEYIEMAHNDHKKMM